ncbi:MAG: hypothetical protein ACPG1C_08870 [Alphaproteobacteria bacterium]
MNKVKLTTVAAAAMLLGSAHGAMAQDPSGVIDAGTRALNAYSGNGNLPVLPLLDPSMADLVGPASLEAVFATVETLPYVSGQGLPLTSLGLETLRLDLGGQAIPLNPVLGPLDSTLLPIVDGFVPKGGLLP